MPYRAVMSSAAAVDQTPAPIVIYRSVNRDGETYAIEPRSLDVLREAFGAEVHPRPRLFIAHETRSGYEHFHGELAPQIVILLTGLTEDALERVGGVVFRDALTDRDLHRP